ncbi:MAG: hypothetical protein Q9207_003747 [Kuettlingeria erythrocarpa]
MQTINHAREGGLREVSDEWVRVGGQQFDIAIIVLAAMNVAAACIMVAIIVYDASIFAKIPSYTLPRNPLYLRVHPTDILPLTTSIAIIFQGAIFLVVQSTTRDAVTSNCEVIAQVIWPAIWIVPFTMLVFGLEATFRALHYKHFRVQKRWNIISCVVVILILILVTWIPSNVLPARHECLTSLVWWTKPFAKFGLVIASGLMLIYIVCATVITARLLRTLHISRDQRIAATRIVYYLIFSTLITVRMPEPCTNIRLIGSQALVIPFFARIAMRMPAIETSQIAEIALNVLGILHLLLHVSLRSSAEITAIQPMQGVRARRQGPRLFGPSEMITTNHITSPVILDKSENGQFDNDNHKLMSDLRRFSLAAKYHSPPILTAKSPTTPTTVPKTCVNPYHRTSIPSPPQALLSPRTPRKTSNYSLFPTFRSAMLRNSTSTTFSQDDTDQEIPPLPSKPLLPFNHKREFSEQSSATVHFMYRLSDARAGTPPPPQPLSPASSSSFRLPLYDGTDGSGVESPPVSPMSIRPYLRSEASSDVLVLPTQTEPDKDGGNDTRHSRSGYLSPSWLVAREKSRSRSQQERYRRMTMKSLPPDPPVEDTPRPPDCNAQRES